MSSFEDAVDALRRGHVVVIPTDTVYGVAVDPTVEGATARLFAAKRRPFDVRLPVLVDSVEQATEVADLDPRARTLMARFWPGGLTIVLPMRTGVDLVLGNGAGAPTVGVRCPDHDVPRRLCTAVGPLATTSANLHGQATPPTAAEVEELFGDAVAVVVDGGRCEGEPSTVVDLTGSTARLVREGTVPWSDVLGVAG
ncbi:MAG: threonylcarbamoyl-AMP synthase [Acidimicrobiia bacterium]|nr:threonylcarbamoyl-AMP synthase [Acidimicrobiia bacterium]MBV9040552.1 threonylcarbamoyl-AMP synthase [Acidimicrobiia bacterium]MBV9283919.1 threonylcarbamoyl-AMP synthase [Acidimicrobiia bacterium]